MNDDLSAWGARVKKNETILKSKMTDEEVVREIRAKLDDLNIYIIKAGNMGLTVKLVLERYEHNTTSFYAQITKTL